MVTLKQARLESGLKTGFILKRLSVTYACLYMYESGEVKVSDKHKKIFSELYQRNDIKYPK